MNMAYEIDLLDEINMRLSDGLGYEVNEYLLLLEAQIIEGEVRNDDKGKLDEMYRVINNTTKK